MYLSMPASVYSIPLLYFAVALRQLDLLRPGTCCLVQFETSKGGWILEELDIVSRSYFGVSGVVFPELQPQCGHN